MYKLQHEIISFLGQRKIALKAQDDDACIKNQHTKTYTHTIRGWVEGERDWHNLQWQPIKKPHLCMDLSKCEKCMLLPGKHVFIVREIKFNCHHGCAQILQ